MRKGLTYRLAYLVVVPIVAQFIVMGLAGQSQQQSRQEQLTVFAQRHPESAAVLREFGQDVGVNGLFQLCIGLSFTLVAGAIAARLARRTAHEIRKLQGAAAEIASGNLEGAIEAEGSREIRDLSKALSEMRDGLRVKVRLEVEAGALARDRDLADATHRLFLPGAEILRWHGATVEGQRHAPDDGGRSFWQRRVLSDGRLLVLVGDGELGGTAGAMVASVVATCLRVHARFAHFDEDSFMRSIDRALGESAQEEGVSLDVVLLDRGKNRGVLLNAGGLGLVLVDERGPRRLTGAGNPLCLGETHWSRHEFSLDGLQELALSTVQEHSGVLLLSPANDASAVRVCFGDVA